jgi:hypothetical protein
MQSLCTATGVAGLFLISVVSPLAAQIDYRNLDDERPVLSEDAYPAELRYHHRMLANQRPWSPT